MSNMIKTSRDHSETVRVQGPKVYIILPVHNRCKITLAFIECLKKQTYDNYHLILIDDGSTDGTAEDAKKRLNNVTVIRGKGKWWWGGSLHQGYKWLKKNNARGDNFVLIMNDDTQFDENFIATGASIIKDNPSTLLTATGYNVKTSKPQDSGGYTFVWENLGCLETYECSEMNCLSTRGMITRVSDFLSIGGFYPRLVPHYLSDLEFTMRGHKNGLRLMIHPDFRIYIDFEATGFRELGNESFSQYLKKVFSKRAAMNPIHWSNFILLHSPYKYKLANLASIWSSVFRQGVIERLLPEIRKRINRMLR